jgi:23S rRNA pseudouridine2605 synthase
MMLVRLQKVLADAGVASRRASEEIIRSGRVTVNGQAVREMGCRVDPLHDSIAVDGAPVRPKRKLYLALHKPIGFVCSRRDPNARRTVGELLPKEWSNLYTVGRLDYNSEGLLFLTNDGQFALRLTHPRYGVPKKYQAVVQAQVGLEVIHKLTKGLFHEGERLKATRARILKASRSQSIVELELTEGKNREVRRLFEAQGLKVASLKRVQIGPIKLGELPMGRWRNLSPVEVQSLLKQGEERPSDECQH